MKSAATPSLQGFHHLTLVTAQAQRNVAFWRDLLGLRLVKTTVNFDDPASYHLYFGDRLGRPGTAITFFEWPYARRGQAGVGGTLDFALGHGGAPLVALVDRLRAAGVAVAEGERGFELADFDGTRLRLVEVAGESLSGPERWRPGLREIAVMVSDLAAARRFYGELLGLVERSSGEEDRQGASSLRFAFDERPDSPALRLLERDERTSGHARFGAGQTHHFALAVADREVQQRFRQRLVAAGLGVSPVMDRVYFQSIYTRDPDGHIVELATAGPGFTVDESEEALGASLRLPPWLEGERATIAAGLTPLAAAPAEATR